MAMAAGLVTDGALAQSGARAAEFWSLREHLPEANRRIGSVSSHDISLPLSEIPRFLDDAGAMLAPMGDMRINCFGHLGDGNLHYNVFPARGRRREDYDDRRAARDQAQAASTNKVNRTGDTMSGALGAGDTTGEGVELVGDRGVLQALLGVLTQGDPDFAIVTP